MGIPRLFYFCYFAAMASLTPFLALYYRQLGLSEGQIGLLAGIPPLLGLVAAPLWGALADATQQHRRLLTLAVIGSIGAVAILSQVTTLAWLLPVVALYAFCNNPIIPLVDNSVLLMLGDRKAEYGKHRLWGAIGWGVAAMVLGALIERAGLHWAFVGCIGLMGGCLYAAQKLNVQHVSIGQPFWQGMRFFITLAVGRLSHHPLFEWHGRGRGQQLSLSLPGSATGQRKFDGTFLVSGNGQRIAHLLLW